MGGGDVVLIHEFISVPESGPCIVGGLGFINQEMRNFGLSRYRARPESWGVLRNSERGDI